METERETVSYHLERRSFPVRPRDTGAELDLVRASGLSVPCHPPSLGYSLPASFGTFSGALGLSLGYSRWLSSLHS